MIDWSAMILNKGKLTNWIEFESVKFNIKEKLSIHKTVTVVLIKLSSTIDINSCANKSSM